jgi:hypothetical protein
MEFWYLAAALIGAALVYVTVKLSGLGLLFGALLWEKRFIRYLAPADAEERAEVDDYIDEARPVALAEGFEFINTLKPQRGPWREMFMDLWSSDDRRIMGVVCAGRIFGVPFERTAFYSVLTNGTRLTTADGFDEGDPAGTKGTIVSPESSFRELLEVHRRRIVGGNRQPVAFGGSDPLGALEDLERSHVQHLVDGGFARYRDLTHNCWSYTLRGAWAICFRAHPAELRELRATETPTLSETAE